MELNNLREFVSEAVNALSSPTSPVPVSRPIRPILDNNNDGVTRHNLSQLDVLLQELASRSSQSAVGSLSVQNKYQALIDEIRALTFQMHANSGESKPPTPTAHHRPPTPLPFDHSDIFNQILNVTNQMENIQLSRITTTLITFLKITRRR